MKRIPRRNEYLLGNVPHPASRLSLPEEIELIRRELAKDPTPYTLQERGTLQERLERLLRELEVITHGG